MWAHLTAQLAPISMPATNLWWNKIVVTMDARFAYCKYSMDGLSLAALATKYGFSWVDEMLQFTFAAPAVLQADTYVNVNHGARNSGVKSPEVFSDQ